MGEERLSMGVIGAGGIARRRTIPGMLKAENIRLAAVMNPSGADEIAASFGVGRAYTSHEDLLADPDVRAVYIASPVAFHGRQIEAAAEAGKHVLCEKPLTLTLEEAKRAAAACERRNVFLQEGYMMKFHGAHRAIGRYIGEGRLGRLVFLRAQLACWYPPMAGAWRQDPVSGGGGSLIDMATHLLDLIEYLAGPIRRVAALTGNLVQEYRSEDAATLLLDLASGAHATVEAFFCIPDEASRTRLEFYGSRGALLSEGTVGQGSGGRLEGIFGLGEAGYEAGQNKEGTATFEPIEFPQVDPYQAQCEYFAQCVLEGRPPAINNAENALRILHLTERAYAAARTGAFAEV